MTGKVGHIWTNLAHANNTKHVITPEEKNKKKNKCWKKKNCIEMDALRQRVTTETLGMGSVGGWVGEGQGEEG